MMKKFTTKEFIDAVAETISQTNKKFKKDERLTDTDMVTMGYVCMAANRLEQKAELLLNTGNEENR